ncbi:MAG: protein kinase domain-containing protein [Micromonosporaceae bacterium]
MADTQATRVPEIPGYRDLVLHRRGSSADIYQAHSEAQERTVAIKLMRLDEMTTYEQYRQELDTAVQLSQHPHVVRILDTGAIGDRPYLVMEFCADGSYAEIVAERGPLAIRDAVDVGITIAEALHSAHLIGFIHRDVTPANVLRSEFGPALSDFGIARKPAELTGTITLNKLTPHHAAPEALRREPQSPQSDIYSLGSTLWQLLVGYPPFAMSGERNPDPFTYRERALHRPPPLVPRPDVPVWLQSEIARAMAKRPADRHPSASAFADALRRGWETDKGQQWQRPVAYPPLSSPPASDDGGTPPAAGAILAADAPAAVSGDGSGAPMGSASAPPGGSPPTSAPPGGSPPTSAPPASAPPGSAPSGSAPPGGPPAALPPQSPAAVYPQSPVAYPHSPAGFPQSPAGFPQSPAGFPQSPVAYQPGPAAAPPGHEPWMRPSSGGPAGAFPPAQPEVGPAPAPPTPRPAEPQWAPVEDERRRKLPVMGFVAAGVVGIVLGAIIIVVLKVLPGAAPPPPEPGPTPSAAPASIAADKAPTGVTIDDKGDKVVISWTDHTGGTAPHYLVGGPEGASPRALTQVEKGVSTVTIDALNPETDYCFTVIAVISVDEVAPSKEKCTNRA